MLRILVVFLGLGVSDTAVMAQAAEEIVVTGSRITRYESETVPAVHLRRNADFIVVNAYIESDSRNAKLRRDEVNKTLRSLQKAASQAADIELGLSKSFETADQEIEYVVPFELDEVSISNGYRQDTSRVSFIIKTPITDNDTDPDVLYERIEAFMDSVKVTGRAEVTDSDGPNLSLVNIAQYRKPLLEAIAADNAQLRAIFGEGYDVSIDGLHEPIRWRVVGPLQVAVYFPYRSSLYVD